MHRLIALLLCLTLGVGPLAACGEDPQTAQQFCADHGGVAPGSEEPDGDATCEDGTEFEGDGDSSSSKKKKSKSKSRSKRR